MLILTRRVGETFVIGDNGEIRVTVTGVQGRTTRISIDAPRNIPVHREEIHNRIKK